MKTALIAGATGLVGRQLVDKILVSDRYSRVIGMSRSNMGVNHPKFSNIISDFHQLGEALNDLKPDDVFCCLGTTMAKAGSKEKFYEVDFHFPLSLAKITFALGARQYLLVSALGADKKSSIYYNRVKGEVEEAVGKVGFYTVHIFRPSLLLGPRQERRAGEDAAKWLYKVFSFAIPGRYKAISSERVANAMLRAAEQEHQGTFVHDSHEMREE